MFYDPAVLANNAAAEARERALIDSGQLGATSSARCSIRPGTDSVIVRRFGPPKTVTSQVSVTVTQGPHALAAYLTPSNARRIAMAMLDAADEADGTERLAFTVETLGGGPERVGYAVGDPHGDFEGIAFADDEGDS